MKRLDGSKEGLGVQIERVDVSKERKNAPIKGLNAPWKRQVSRTIRLVALFSSRKKARDPIRMLRMTHTILLFYAKTKVFV